MSQTFSLMTTLTRILEVTTNGKLYASRSTQLLIRAPKGLMRLANDGFMYILTFKCFNKLLIKIKPHFHILEMEDTSLELGKSFQV